MKTGSSAFSPIRAATLLVVTLCLSSCLKTRAQLRDDGTEEDRPVAAAKGVPNPVQDVQPHGQYVVDEIKGEITRLTGRIEDLERQKQESANAANQSSREEFKKLEQRIIELEQAQAQMLDAIKKLQETPAPVADSSELFTKAKGQFEAKNYDGAIETLNAYLKNPSPKRMEDATFLRAESYYHLKQYKKAIIDYSKFPEKHVKSSYMPVALLKIGLSFEALGMKEDAKGFFHELVDKFPKSPEAKKAKAKL